MIRANVEIDVATGDYRYDLPAPGPPGKRRGHGAGGSAFHNDTVPLRRRFHGLPGFHNRTIQQFARLRKHFGEDDRADRRRFAVWITSYAELDISIPFEWSATAAEVTERVRAAMDDLRRVGWLVNAEPQA
jgi:hypothetical protein